MPWADRLGKSWSKWDNQNSWRKSNALPLSTSYLLLHIVTLTWHHIYTKYFFSNSGITRGTMNFLFLSTCFPIVYFWFAVFIDLMINWLLVLHSSVWINTSLLLLTFAHWLLSHVRDCLCFCSQSNFVILIFSHLKSIFLLFLLSSISNIHLQLPFISFFPLMHSLVSTCFHFIFSSSVFPFSFYPSLA